MENIPIYIEENTSSSIPINNGYDEEDSNQTIINASIHISSGYNEEDSNTSSIIQLDKDFFAKIFIRYINSIAYIDNPVEFSKLLDINQIKELFNLLLYYVTYYKTIYGTPSIEVVLDDNSTPSYLKLVFPDCNWEEWGMLDKDLLKRENLLKGYLMIGCIKGLIE